MSPWRKWRGVTKWTVRKEVSISSKWERHWLTERQEGLTGGKETGRVPIVEEIQSFLLTCPISRAPGGVAGSRNQRRETYWIVETFYPWSDPKFSKVLSGLICRDGLQRITSKCFISLGLRRDKENKSQATAWPNRCGRNRGVEPAGSK